MKENIKTISNKASENTDFSEALPAFSALMRKVYMWMTFALLITGGTSYLVASLPNVINTVITNQF